MHMISKNFGKFIFSILLALTFSAIEISAANFTLTNTGDTGAGSLRQAVLDSNAAATSDAIVFDSAVFSSPQTITLASVIAINPANSASGDIAVTGDFDGDGRFDTAVFRPSNTTWFINGTTAGTIIAGFGAPGDFSVPNSFVP